MNTEPTASVYLVRADPSDPPAWFVVTCLGLLALAAGALLGVGYALGRRRR